MSSGPSHTKLVDLEDPAYQGKSMAQVERAVWEKDVEALKSLGVHLAEDHMDGYLFQPDRQEKILDVKPWETSPLETLVISSYGEYTYTAENWANPDLKFEIKDGIAYMMINRPEVNNTMGPGVTNGLGCAADILCGRPDIRLATLTGAGRMFCAGADPTSMTGGSKGPKIEGAPPSGMEITGFRVYVEGQKKSGNFMATMLYKVASLPQFTIACLNGSAMAGGVGLACVCDMIIAVKQAYITVSEVKLGMIPATISPHVIGKMGVKNAKRLFCTAENMKAHTAMECGLVQHVVDAKEGFQPVIEDVCKKLQGVAPGAVKASKDIMIRTFNGTISNGMIEYLVDEYVKSRKGTEAEACMRAISERKKPPWLESPLVPQPLF